MGSSNINAIVPRVLNDDNYEDWSTRLRTYLQAQNVWDVIEEATISSDQSETAISSDNNDLKRSSEEFIKDNIEKENNWRLKNAKALHAIQISCGDDTYCFIRDTDSAKIAWDILAEKFRPVYNYLGVPVQRPNKNSSSLGANCNPTNPLVNDNLLEAFFNAARSGKLETVKKFLDTNANIVRARHQFSDQTALHIAALSGHVNVVEELVSRMEEKDLEMRSDNGWTALVNATINGDTRIAMYIVGKNKNLVTMETDDPRRSIPLELALSFGHVEMAHFLYSITPLEALLENQGTRGATVIIAALRLHCYDIVFNLLVSKPSLAVALSYAGESPVFRLATISSAFPSGTPLRFWQRWIYDCIRIQQYNYVEGEMVHINIRNLEENQAKRWKIYNVPGVKHIYEMKLAHLHSSAILRRFCKVIKSLNRHEVKKALVDMALIESISRGHEEFFVAIMKTNPELIWLTDSSRKDAFMLAIQYRKPKIFGLIHGITSKQAKANLVDDFGNTMLHMAGLLVPETQLSRIPGAALQMQRELQWFKEVEKIMLPHRLGHKNLDGLTARELFTKSHKDLLIAGEKWMKGTASSCTVVGSLIITVTFAGAFTVPGGTNQDTGFPIFSAEKLFKVFITSDAISLFSATTSVLMFLGILTSRYSEDDFLKSLPTKLIIGLSTLFLSIATMTIAFCAALFIMLRGELRSVIPISLLASLPVFLFVGMQFPLLIEIFKSTYGRSIFDRKVKRWL